MEDMFLKCKEAVELKYLVRMLSPAGLRIGISNKSFEKCLLSYISSLPNKQQLLDDFEQNIFGYRIQEKSDVSVIGVPLKPMVGRPAKSVEEVLTEMKPDLICEIKYDGERTQIHYNDGEINLFSRNFDNQN
jgi:DNA ligase 1